MRAVEHVGSEPHAVHEAGRTRLQRVPIKWYFHRIRHKLSSNG